MNKEIIEDLIKILIRYKLAVFLKKVVFCENNLNFSVV